MSRKNQVEQCLNSCVQHQLRSGKSRGPLSVIEGGNQTGAFGPVNPHALDDVEELQKKLQMAQAVRVGNHVCWTSTLDHCCSTGWTVLGVVSEDPVLYEQLHVV